MLITSAPTKQVKAMNGVLGGLPVLYSSGSLDGKRPGVFRINLGDVGAFKRFEVPTIALHEGDPGHNFHFGTFNARVRGLLPDFLVLSTTVDYAAAPSRTSLLSAHSEGWGGNLEHALYSFILRQNQTSDFWM